jgi:hypothetical protein
MSLYPILITIAAKLAPDEKGSTCVCGERGGGDVIKIRKKQELVAIRVSLILVN